MAKTNRKRNTKPKSADGRSKSRRKMPPGVPPNSIYLEDLPYDPPKAGMVVWTAIYNLGGAEDVLLQFNVNDYHFGVGQNTEGRCGLWYQLTDGDLVVGDVSDWSLVWMKMSFLVEAMSILTCSNLWIGDTLWCDNKVAWQRPKGVGLVPEKEYSIEPIAIQELFGDMEVGVATVNLHYHIAINFPRAWGHHHTGCYLLRTSFPGVDYHSDALLNFFKIGEMITARMYAINPQLRDIQRASKELGLDRHFSDDDIANFYRIRSRDAAHDWLQASR